MSERPPQLVLLESSVKQIDSPGKDYRINALHGVASRGALDLADAETIDRARKMWWLRPRNVENEKYTADGANFDHDERDFRKGFGVALQLSAGLQKARKLIGPRRSRRGEADISRPTCKGNENRASG